MTPEEHYRWGEGLLRGAQEQGAGDPIGAQTLAVIAGAHFQAAAAGTGMRALAQMQESLQPGPEPHAYTDDGAHSCTACGESEPARWHIEAGSDG